MPSNEPMFNRTGVMAASEVNSALSDMESAIRKFITAASYYDAIDSSLNVDCRLAANDLRKLIDGLAN